MKQILSHKIVFVGAGNLATNLANALHHVGFEITQVYSRTVASASLLAKNLSTSFTTEISKLNPDADLYIISLKDDALVEHIAEIVANNPDAMFVHTAGSVSIDLFKSSTATRYGVFYPMQTFNKSRLVDFKNIPFFIESSNEQDLTLLRQIASLLSEKVYDATSVQRKSLHLAAVFTCNFSNHMYALAEKLLQKYDLPFEVMLPLIDETASKVHQISPKEAQTGPAIRRDENVINNHLEMLKDEESLHDIYKFLSNSIKEL